MMTDLELLLEQSAARHKHLCPRQVLGVRIGLAGAAALDLEAPRNDKRMLVITETDGCYADGVEVATGATIGHRTLRVADYGKVASTFVDVKIGTAVRIAPRLGVRQRASFYSPEEQRRYFAQLKSYQIMPDDELLMVEEVHLTTPIEDLISRPGVRVNCAICGEEIINEREVWKQDMPLCQACAGPVYYVPARPKSLISRSYETALAGD